MDLNFKQVQDLLLGQAILNLKRNKYTSQIKDNTYQLKFKKGNDFFDALLKINPLTFKVKSQEIRQPNNLKSLHIFYPKYMQVMKEQLPKKMNIHVVDDKKHSKINVTYKQVEFNKRVTFPFKIPKGYKEIKLK